VLGAALGLKASRNKQAGPKSMSAKDQSALMAQSHRQNLEMETHRAGLARDNDTYSVAARHVVGEEAADSAHKRGMEASYQDKLFKNTEGMAERASKEKLARGTNSVERAKLKSSAAEAAASRQHETDRTERLTTAVASNPNISSFNAQTGSISTTHPMGSGQQFNGVGGE